MLWFYLDTEGKRQGPFYPGQMRQWFDAGYFPETQKIAPSFKGEVPKQYEELGILFRDQTAEAFLSKPGIALWPPAAAQSPSWVEEEEEEEARAKPVVGRPRWLEDSIRRQKAGIKRKMMYGPTERENYN